MQRNVSRKSCWMFSTARGRFVERVFPSGGKRGVFVGFSEPTRKTPSGLPSGLFWVGVPSGLFRVGVPSGLFRVGVPSGLFRVGFPSGCSEKRFPVTPTQIHCVEWLLISRLIFPVGFFEFVFPSGFFRMAFSCFSLPNTFCWLLSQLSQIHFVECSLISNTICWKKKVRWSLVWEIQIHFYVRGKEETHSEKSTTGFSENSTKCIREKGIKSKCKLLNKYILLNVRWSRGWFVLFWACLMCFWQLFCVGRSTAFCMFKCVVDTVSRIDSMIGLFCRI